MIQRIQTIFLLFAAIAFAALIPLPFATTLQESQGIFSDGRYSIIDNVVLEILTGVGILLLLVSIFMYKKRKVQIRLNYLVIFLTILILVVAYVHFTNEASTITDSEIQKQAGILMPVAGMIFTTLAIYFIRKDERLVKSMDRLR